MTPPFDPSRVPPDSLDGAARHINHTVPLEWAHELLGIAWAAFDRARADPPVGTVLCNPACTERCANCRLECAVILSGLQMAYRDYQDALAADGPVLSLGGSVYTTMAGRA
ncbi:hypothetical protein [Sphingomonas sp. Leaf25]|uniref:hypothetical protein n=1 Tax=Sphingomonas sp. Leaf25 TaxID=1735692 RepID=UPI0006F84178|nr:hypothetical protein [Sphingomonas sp. Leaf25]KQM98750.1 hypothetical protein ASE78_05855 [Sphingomonas sp. Leaf25]